MVATSDAMARVRYVGLLTAAAMVAFAANSVLCRAAALGGGQIDAASFSSIRLLSGALALSAIHAVRRGARTPRKAGWSSAALLFLYAVPFSFAYNTLTTGTGALILFAAVQATMLVAGLAAGERPRLLQWIGLGRRARRHDVPGAAGRDGAVSHGQRAHGGGRNRLGAVLASRPRCCGPAGRIPRQLRSQRADGRGGQPAELG